MTVNARPAQDDEAELLAELERIKRERAEEAARKASAQWFDWLWCVHTRWPGRRVQHEWRLAWGGQASTWALAIAASHGWRCTYPCCLQAAEAAARAEVEEQAELVRGNPLLQEKLAAQGEHIHKAIRTRPPCLVVVFWWLSSWQAGGMASGAWRT